MLTLVLGFSAERTAHYQLSNGYGRKRIIIICQRTNRIHDSDDAFTFIALRKASNVILGCDLCLIHFLIRGIA